MTSELRSLDLVLSRPGSGVSVVSRGDHDITVEGDFDDVLMLLSRIRNDGRMVPVASMPVAIPGGGVQVHVQLSPVVVPGEVISPPARSTSNAPHLSAGWSWRTASRVCLVPLGAGAVGGVVVGAVVATGWVIGVAAVHPALAFVFAMVFMVAGAVGVAARSDPGVGCVDSGGPKPAAESDEEDSGEPAGRAPVRRRRVPVRRLRWVDPIRQRVHRVRPDPVQEVAPEALESVPVEANEDPPPPVRVSVFRRTRWMAAPVPAPTRMATPPAPHPAPIVAASGCPEVDEGEPFTSPVEVELDLEPELDRHRFRVPTERPRWFPVRTIVSAGNERRSVPACTVITEPDKDRSRWAASTPVEFPAPEPVPTEDDPKGSPQPASNLDSAVELGEPARLVRPRMRFWPDRAAPGEPGMRPAVESYPAPVVSPDVDEDVESDPVTPVERRAPSRVPARWWSRGESSEPETRHIPAPTLAPAPEPFPVKVVQPEFEPDADLDQAPTPSFRRPPLRWSQLRSVPELAPVRGASARPVRLPDPHTAQWVSALRDSGHAQSDDAYVSSDADCRCVLGWGFDQRRGVPANLRSMRAQYGRRFCNDIEQKNGSGRWSLPDLADYIERKRG